MKKLLFTTAILAFTFAVATAQNSDAKPLNEKQVSEMDMSGKWVGKRFQYTADHQGILQTFEYEFNFKQEGNRVNGTTSIYSENGDYGDMKMRGIIVGNKLIFEEYEIADEHQSNPLRTWCFKAGELTFAQDGNSVKLVGATNSHIPYYNIPCTGGFSDMSKVDGENTIDFSKNISSKLNERDFKLNVSPNPFVEKANVSFYLDKNAEVQLNIMDLSGKEIAELQNGQLEKGTYNFEFNANKSPIAATNYIVTLKVNGEIYSSLLSKMNY